MCVSSKASTKRVEAVSVSRRNTNGSIRFGLAESI
jgi:hypothetical protein